MFLYCACFFFLFKYVYQNNITCKCSIIHDCCTRVTVVLEYILSQPRGEQLARPIRSEVILFTVKKIARLLKGTVSVLFRFSPPRSLNDGCGCKPIANGIPITITALHGVLAVLIRYNQAQKCLST